MIGRDHSRESVLGPAVAGTWYPADGDALRREVDDLLGRADAEARQSRRGERVCAVVAPHAGFVYSGLVAAKGFRQLGDARCERVVLIGPSHYAAFRGAMIPDATAYRTPIGDVGIDVPAVRELREIDGFDVGNRPFRPEHCLEAELPFLQRKLPSGWRVLPVLIGALADRSDTRRIADGLRALVDAGTLVVVSSDFTHYGPRFHYVPFTDDVERGIETLDMGAVRLILNRDADGFHQYVERTGATVCGRNAIRVLLELLPAQGIEVSLAAYDTSGRITGEWGHSVSYASLVFHSTSS